MMQIDHRRHCLEQLGQPFPEVHAWLDQYARRWRGYTHRVLLHHRRGVELAVRQFGEEARAAAELHVRDDLGRLPVDPADMEDLYMPLPHEDEAVRTEMRRLYGTDFELGG